MFYSSDRLTQSAVGCAGRNENTLIEEEREMTEIPLKEHIAPSGEPMTVRDLTSCPPPEKWRDWMEYDAKAWPRKVERHYEIIPTICFNCEAACGLLAY